MSRRQIFRPRPLKLSQQIPIYWTEEEILANLDVKGNGIRILSDYVRVLIVNDCNMLYHLFNFELE